MLSTVIDIVNFEKGSGSLIFPKIFRGDSSTCEIRCHAIAQKKTDLMDVYEPHFIVCTASSFKKDCMSNQYNVLGMFLPTTTTNELHQLTTGPIVGLSAAPQQIRFFLVNHKREKLTGFEGCLMVELCGKVLDPMFLA